MTRVLALETATDACSIALQVDDELLSRHIVEPRKHADRLLYLVDELLASAGLTVTALDAIALGAGPGSFTGVRIAAAAAQGLAYAADLPLVQVSSLAVAALGVQRRHAAPHVAIAFDARMDEVYFGAFVHDGTDLRVAGEQRVADLADISLPTLSNKWFAAGAGWSRYLDRLQPGELARIELSDDPALPEARDVITLAIPKWRRGETVPPAEVAPVYLRDRVTR
ncbi:MAG: tRNA (adenosine(37)-N6)-threonylcarbamoyltransferase complex dimerization subunit type 1 TsaB [Pseudomonadota bacterium]